MNDKLIFDLGPKFWLAKDPRTSHQYVNPNGVRVMLLCDVVISTQYIHQDVITVEHEQVSIHQIYLDDRYLLVRQFYHVI
jgi:hypothetical protein